ncbi:ArnT family glycosyltransferase [Mesonia aestuariivivens]|uniref:Glycosyltransferase family 39 protein n=1 Tax=Mesonia aestuariivivens TaxID=2796128 RepID=A0ABS6W445_9FLAO|nr:glycosyltransferase family 39 protein [Mesonia aestuariivivens]MBW2962589.1 glycosyltransferase family 39 protein [Mesonia aestuariivivens]
MNKKKHYTYYLLIIIGLIFFVNLDVIYVNIMEARNFISAREMVRLDHWLLTTLNNIPRYQKPPLPTWLTALFGSLDQFKSLILLRLPAALCSLLLIIGFYKTLPKFEITKTQAFQAALILATSFYIIFSGRNGQWDIFTHAFMMISIYYLWKFFNTNKNLYRYALLASIFFGFSLLSKGPVSLYALLLPFLISYGIVYKYKNLKRRWLPLLLFLLAGILIGGWWFFYVRWADPAAFLKIAAKETSNWGSYNIRPWYYYWSFFTQSGIWTIPSFVALLYPYLKNKVSNKKAYLFSFLWTIIAVLLLSIIPEKKSRYLLPVLIPMAFNTSFYIEYLIRKFSTLSIKEKGAVYINHGLIALIGFAFPIAGYFLLDLHGIYWVYFILTSVGLYCTAWIMLQSLKKQHYSRVFYSTIAFVCVIMSFGFPLVKTLLDNPKFHNFNELQELAEKENFEVFDYGGKTPEIIWAYGKPILTISKDSIHIPNANKFGILMAEKDSNYIQKFIDYKVISSDRYDLNYVHPDKKGYKSRLIRKFYLLERKD